MCCLGAKEAAKAKWECGSRLRGALCVAAAGHEAGFARLPMASSWLVSLVHAHLFGFQRCESRFLNNEDGSGVGGSLLIILGKL